MSTTRATLRTRVLANLEGRSDTATVTVPDNANTKLAGARTLGINDTLILMWNSIDWIELSYTSNGP